MPNARWSPRLNTPVVRTADPQTAGSGPRRHRLFGLQNIAGPKRRLGSYQHVIRPVLDPAETAIRQVEASERPTTHGVGVPQQPSSILVGA
jgi:hypothetical protein